MNARFPAIAAVSSLACFALGWWLGSSRPPAPPAPPSPPAASAIVPPPVSAVAPVAPRGATATSSAAEVSRSLREELARLERLPPCEQREEDRVKCLVALAATDPLGALALVKTLPGEERQTRAKAEVLTAWTRTDPDAAWRWAQAVPPEERHLRGLVLTETAKLDAARARAFATEAAQLDPPSATEFGLNVLLGLSYAGNFSAAREFADTFAVPSDDERATLLNFAVGQWSRYEPARTAEWVKQFPAGHVRDQSLIGLGESWSDLDPAAAAAFAAELAPGATRQVVLRQAIGKWIMQAPDAAGQWLTASATHPDFEFAISAVATDRTLVENSPDLALAWATTIRNDSLRVESVAQILTQWSARNANAASAFLDGATQFTEAERAELRRRLNPGSGGG